MLVFVFREFRLGSFCCIQCLQVTNLFEAMSATTINVTHLASFLLLPLIPCSLILTLFSSFSVNHLRGKFFHFQQHTSYFVIIHVCTYMQLTCSLMFLGSSSNHSFCFSMTLYSTPEIQHMVRACFINYHSYYVLSPIPHVTFSLGSASKKVSDQTLPS